MRRVIRAVRRLYWRMRLGLRHVHPTFLAGGYSNISRDFVAGPYSYVGPGCLISPGVSIGAYTMLGPTVKIVGNDHVFDLAGTPIVFSGRPDFKPTHIGSDVWIGASAIILCGIEIGDGAIIGAGAVVTRGVEPFSVVGGVPAKVIRRRFDSIDDELCHQEMLKGEIFNGEYPDALDYHLRE